jgi:hypothetical protein
MTTSDRLSLRAMIQPVPPFSVAACHAATEKGAEAGSRRGLQCRSERGKALGSLQVEKVVVRSHLETCVTDGLLGEDRARHYDEPMDLICTLSK